MTLTSDELWLGRLSLRTTVGCVGVAVKVGVACEDVGSVDDFLESDISCVSANDFLYVQDK